MNKKWVNLIKVNTLGIVHQGKHHFQLQFKSLSENVFNFEFFSHWEALGKVQEQNTKYHLDAFDKL